MDLPRVALSPWSTFSAVSGEADVVNIERVVFPLCADSCIDALLLNSFFKFEIFLLVNLAIESKLLTSIFAANFSMSHFTLLDDFNAKKSWWPFLKLDLSVLYFSGNFI